MSKSLSVGAGNTLIQKSIYTYPTASCYNRDKPKKQKQTCLLLMISIIIHISSPNFYSCFSTSIASMQMNSSFSYHSSPQFKTLQGNSLLGLTLQPMKCAFGTASFATTSRVLFLSTSPARTSLAKSSLPLYSGYLFYKPLISPITIFPVHSLMTSSPFRLLLFVTST